MTEKHFLSCLLTEGVLLVVIGFSMLVLPKLTAITFGMMICLSFIIYGGYKTINAIITRNYTKHFVLNIISGLILAALGIFLFLAPMFDFILLKSIVALYLILESISSFAFSVQNKKTLYFWWMGILTAVFQFLLSLLILLGLPAISLWLIGVFAGINFLFAGIISISMYIATKYNSNF